MQSKRPIVLMGILIVVLAGYMAWTHWPTPYPNAAAPARAAPPLPGANSITGLEVHRDAKGRWMAGIDYYYTGDPQYARVAVALVRDGKRLRDSDVRPALRGTQHIEMELAHPVQIDPVELRGEVLTTAVEVEMRGAAGVATRRVEHRIQWPEYFAYQREQQLAGKTDAQILDQAVALIDTDNGDNVRDAKGLLDRVIARSPQFDAAYIELARVAMKLNWSPEGLHQADALLRSALQIRPDGVNAKVLLGYVEAHQQHYAAAEKLFVEAAAGETKNLWLWANWGELLLMQGKPDAAIAKYREAVARPRGHDTYDRARLDAYRHLFALLERRKELDGMEALHKQRAEEFGPGSCYSADYAAFVLQQRGETARAIALARQALGSCHDTLARDVLGMAFYLDWATGSGPERQESLNQARAYLPPGPHALYRLATSERTYAAAKRLVAAGEAIDQRDNQSYPALAYALRQQDHATARRLLRLGAKPDALVGLEQVPLALLPVMVGDVDGIKLMRQAGIDYTRLRYQGMTAIDHARQIGDRRLQEALDPKANSL